MNNNKELPFAYSAEDISRINSINLKDPHSVSALNAINISTTENKINPHNGSTIEIENPKSALELVDAAANYVAQIRIALLIGDKSHANKAVEEAARLLCSAVNTLNKQE